MPRKQKMTYIECSYWTCTSKQPYFKVNEEAEYKCARADKWMGGHSGSNAPDWCPRRKKNGGEE